LDLGLKGKWILLTGASDGFGAALAQVLAEEGANLVLHELDLPDKREKLEALCAELSRARGVKARPEYADLSDKGAARALLERAEAETPLYGLVNNAAIWPTAMVREMTQESFERTLAINLVAPFVLCKAFVRALDAGKRQGKIVNMVSQAAFHGSTSGHAHYAASKAGLVGFTVSLAREVAPQGINVNAVAPGMMRTPMNRQALAEREAEYLARIPLRRIAEPREVAYAVAFLLGRTSDYITGATLDATGGMLMR